MTYHNFSDFLGSLERYDDRLALTIRTFIKIERLNYVDLRRRVNQVAQYLQSEGLKPGDRVMVIAPSSPQWVELFLGAQLIGVTIVSVDAQSSLETVQGYARQTEPQRIFKSRYLLPELADHYETIVLEEIDSLCAGQKQTAPAYQLTGRELAVIVFTSGTTADPKGVMLTQRNILANVSGVQEALTIDPNWRALSVLPLSHMYELTGCLALLSGGASIFYVPRVTPLAIVRGLKDYQITVMLAVPQLLIQFLERIRQAAEQTGRSALFEHMLRIASRLPFSARRLLFRSVHKGLGGHLDMVVTGGAPIPLDVATTWERMGVRMVQGYGLTESAPIIAVNNPTARRLDSQGPPLGNIELRLDDATKEVQVRGPSVFAGYWQNTVATKAAFTSDGWFKTGDVGQLDNGFLQVRGRTKFTITLASGLKVMPEDIEIVAERHPRFKALCIVGVHRAGGEEVQTVIISDKSDHAINTAIADLNSDLESFQHISSWTRWPEQDFPRTRLLKVDRRRVQDWANMSAHTKPQVSVVKHIPGDPLVTIIRLALNKPTERIHKHDRLSDLGLDSLRRLTVVSLIEEQLGVHVTEAAITQHTTVTELRHMVERGTPVMASPTWPKWTYWPWVRILGGVLRETLLRGVVRIWVAQRTEGANNIKDLSGPALYIFNHVDNLDGPVIYRALPRSVRRHLAVATADDVMHSHKVLAFVQRLCFAAFNFARVEPIMPSMEYAARLADQGWNIALAPEGKISADGELQPFKSGIGLLAVELGIPVIPVKTIGLYGTIPLHKIWPKKRSKVVVRIGRPVYFDTATTYDDATAQLQKMMETL